jgi:hypothetical protein
MQFLPETMVRLDLHRVYRDLRQFLESCDAFRFQWHRTYFRYLFAKYNKNYQNVNSKRLQFTTVYFLTLNDHLACVISDFDSMDTPTTNDSLHTTVASVKCWKIISLFRFFRDFILIGII